MEVDGDGDGPFSNYFRGRPIWVFTVASLVIRLKSNVKCN